MQNLLAIVVFVALIALIGSLLAGLSSSSDSFPLRNPFKRLRQQHNRASPLKEQITTETSLESPSDGKLPIEQLIEVVNAKLPQTQCAQCGHPGCRPYATAIITEEAPINQCPPGGNALISELAELLGKDIIPLDSERGESKPPQVAIIDEPACIGCTLCIAACPVDAIVGASRFMHTVISHQCTGCELCVAPCPVDCISLAPAHAELAQWRWPKPV